jgi:dienelactone hydrolase
MTRSFALWLLAAAALCGQTKRLPPAGLPVADSDRTALSAGLDRLRAATARLRGHPLLPDVLIFQEAVRQALQYDEFFKREDVAKARALLERGQARAAEMAAGGRSWTASTGLVTRGYVSKIDGSVQPYGLVVPPSYSPTAPHRWRVDIWLHGRNETLSEVAFLTDRMKTPGEFTPADTIVLHLYGRYCNANRFAGEVDLFEALDAVRGQYAVDEDRIVVRGFSMGGAAAWHIGAHHAGLWAAVAPGAGFSETAEFLKTPRAEVDAMPAWARALWHWYDATDYAVNFFNTPLVAYNGDQDGQKQAADAMERAMAAEGLRLARVIGPGTAHRYHPESKRRIAAIVDAAAARGREAAPRKVRFTTWTLAYNRMKWVVVDALGRHWERARVDTEVTGASAVEAKTANVEALTFEMPPAACPLDPSRRVTVTIDGQRVTVDGPLSDRSWSAHLRRTAGRWAATKDDAASGLRKRHGLQGPIDDAFLDSFLFVRPTGKANSEAVGKWAEAELTRAIARWRATFRGEARVKDDRDVTDADIAASNLVLWGDPGSNSVMARIAGELPIAWSEAAVAVGAARYAAATHAAILIYPNPLNPKRYVVLNSGFTFREVANANNARQHPYLPDYAVVDVSTPPDERTPGKIVTAGFFDERWRLGR